MARYLTLQFVAPLRKGARFALLKARKEGSWWSRGDAEIHVIEDLDDGPAWGDVFFTKAIQEAVPQHDTSDVTALLTAVGWTVERLSSGRCIRAYVSTRNDGEINTGQTVVLYEPMEG